MSNLLLKYSLLVQKMKMSEIALDCWLLEMIVPSQLALVT
jgi:hypothetical protein